MGEREREQTTPARVYRDLRVVADENEHPEDLVIGVIIDGAFVPIASHNKGLVEAMKARWNELGGASADSSADATTQGLEQRVAELEKTVMELQAQRESEHEQQPAADGGEQQHEHE